MTRTILSIAVLALAGASGAYAAKDVHENAPLQSGGKAQVHGDTHKEERKAKSTKKPASTAANSKTETGRGQGSGVVSPSAAEQAGERAAAIREARPHKETTQGVTPK